MDAAHPSLPIKEFFYKQNRFKMLQKSDPDAARRLLDLAQHDVDERWRFYEGLAGLTPKVAPAADGSPNGGAAARPPIPPTPPPAAKG